MKRKRLILTTVLLACVAAVVVPYRREIWLAVAYEGHEAEGVRFYTQRSGWLPGKVALVPPQMCASCLKADLHGHCFADHDRKLASIKGLGRNQLRSCGIEISNYRVGLVTSRRWYSHVRAQAFIRGLRPGKKELDGSDFHCTCPDPSHEWNR